MTYSLSREYFSQTDQEFEVSKSSYILESSVRAGVNRNTELEFSWSYLFLEKEKRDFEIFKSHGPREFDFKIRHRFLEKSYTLDFIVLVKPNLADKKIATKNLRGNAISGQGVLSLGAILGKRDKDSEFSLQFNMSYLGNKFFLDQEKNSRYQVGSFYLAELFFTMQPKLKWGHYLKAHIGLAKRGREKFLLETHSLKPYFFGNIGYTYKIYHSLALGLEVNWLEYRGSEEIRNYKIKNHYFSSSFNLIYLFE